MTVENPTHAASANSLPIRPSKPVYPDHAGTKEYAASLDATDPLKDFRNKFIIPSKANINSKKLVKPGMLYNYLSCPSIANNSRFRLLARSMYLLLRKFARPSA